MGEWGRQLEGITVQFHRQHNYNHTKRKLSCVALHRRGLFAFGAATEIFVGKDLGDVPSFFRAIESSQQREKNKTRKKPRQHNGTRKPSGHLCCDKNRFVTILLQIRLPKRGIEARQREGDLVCGEIWHRFSHAGWGIFPLFFLFLCLVISLGWWLIALMFSIAFIMQLLLFACSAARLKSRYTWMAFKISADKSKSLRAWKPKRVYQMLFLLKKTGGKKHPTLTELRKFHWIKICPGVNLDLRN